MMNEQRFTIQNASGMYLHLPIFDNGVEMADGDVCILLNEQQDTIQSLKEENRRLKKRLRKCANNWKQEIVERGKLEEEIEQLKQKLENLGLNEKNDMVEYSIEDFFRWLQRIKKEFEDFEDNGD